MSPRRIGGLLTTLGPTGAASPSEPAIRPTAATRPAALASIPSLSREAQTRPVTVVVVSWNARAHLARCLEALPGAAAGALRGEAGDLRVEVVVVDNGSTDGTLSMLAGRFPDVRVIVNSTNVGYGAAVNTGARAGSGRTVLVLNSDCELGPGALATMVAELANDAGIGAVACQLQNPDGSLQPSVHDDFPSPWSLVGDLVFAGAFRRTVYRTPLLRGVLLAPVRRAHARSADVAWAGGACLLVRRDAFEEVGGFDEGFFMYWEDVDLCRRLRAAGYRIRYLPDATAVHHWGVSAAQRPAAMLHATVESRLRYFRKHASGGGAAVARFLVAGELRVRTLTFSVLAALPSRARQTLLERAEASRRCLGTLSAAEASPAVTPGVALLVALVLLFSAGHYLHDLAKTLLDSPFIDFAHYYTYATVVSGGENPFHAAAVSRVDAALGLRRAGAAANYPPLFYVLVRPWTWLPFRTAAVAWIFAAHVALVVALAVCLRNVRVSWAGAAAALFVVTTYQPVAEDIALGQSNLLVLFAVTLVWWGLRRSHPWVAAAGVALAVNVKVQYALLVPLLWWIGHRRAAARSLVLIGAGAAVGLILLGAAHHVEYVRYLLAPPEYLGEWRENLAPRAVLYRLLAGWGDGRRVANAAAAALTAVLLVAWARRLRDVGTEPHRLDAAWSLGLVAIPLLSPLTEEHHLVVLLLPITLLLVDERRRPGHLGPAIALLAALLLLGSRYSLHRFPELVGLPSLLGTGKLLGVAILAGLLAHELRAGGARSS